MQQHKLKKLQDTLQYTFVDCSLLVQALTHASYGDHNNERLEFLGDSLLGCSISIYLYNTHCDANEGQLSRNRAHLVRRETLAEIADELGIAHYLRLGTGERKSGGQNKSSILADTLEAIVAAVYLDCQNWHTLDTWLRSIFTKKFSRINESVQCKDNKSQLQEWLQARHLALPTYQLLESQEPPLPPLFRVACHVTQLTSPVEAWASTKRQAEQQTAQMALQQLTKTHKNT